MSDATNKVMEVMGAREQDLPPDEFTSLEAAREEAMRLAKEWGTNAWLQFGGGLYLYNLVLGEWCVAKQ